MNEPDYRACFEVSESLPSGKENPESVWLELRLNASTSIALETLVKNIDSKAIATLIGTSSQNVRPLSPEQHDRRIHQFRMDQLSQFELLLCSGQIRIWDIPTEIRRGHWCRTFYILAYRYARDSGLGETRFQEDLAFLKTELKEAKCDSQMNELLQAYHFMVKKMSETNCVYQE